MENDPNENSPDGSTAPMAPGVPSATLHAASARVISLLGFGLIFLAVSLAYLFLCFWPAGLDAGAKSDAQQVIYLAGSWISFNTTVDARLIMMVMVAGALGSFVHTATSFGDFVGNQKLSVNWIWWYILRPFIAMALAAIFYLVVRGGFLSAGTEPGKLNIYGIAALAGMVGMFSKQATDKLGEVFDTLFRTAPSGGDLARKDALDNSLPVLANVDPTSLMPATQNLAIAVNGSHFVTNSIVRINGASRDTVFKNTSQLTVTLLPSDVATEGQLDLTVFNPPPGGGSSTSVKLQVAGAPTRSPVVASTLTPGAADSENHVDGCDVEITAITADEDLPAATGGVA